MSRRVPLATGFESTYLPLHDVDCAETTGHTSDVARQIGSAVRNGVSLIRYPLRWHRIEASPRAYDWHDSDIALGALRDAGAEVVLDLVHHTSHPRWLRDGFADRDFAAAYLRYAEAAARRYGDVAAYTVFNEPFATLFLSGHEALWPPYGKGIASFARLVDNVLPAVSEVSAMWRNLLPTARHVWVDTCEHHVGTPGAAADYAGEANDRRFSMLDLFLHHDVDPQARPFLRKLAAAGATRSLDLPPGRIDVLGLDYYPHSEWYYDATGGRAPSPQPVGLAALIEQYARRYDLPVMVSETNIRGLPADRASWLRYVLEQCEQAAGRGYPVEALCWFPYVDSCDWDSLLARPGGRTDPVGVADADLTRTTSMTRSWRAVADGARAADLPAYRFQDPVAEQLAGYAPQLAHWPWEEPPMDETIPAVTVGGPDRRPASDGRPDAQPAPDARDLVVLSHLRWGWVWQRPQHLVSRLARSRRAAGARTWFVEEPVVADVAAARVRTDDLGDVIRVWLEIPREAGRGSEPGAIHAERDRRDFTAPGTEAYGPLLAALLADRQPVDVWVYTPMAFDIANALERRLLVYDVMDDLASFADAPEGLRLRQRRVLAEADLVLAGGRSLRRSVLPHRPDAHLFPSGVDTTHYAASRRLRRPRDRRVAGYVGVVDERIDLTLLRDLADELADWDIEIVGPVTKIDPATLPTAPNLAYRGQQPYDRLPEIMAGFDVALMPFALNEATQAISPTKTLEYLAAGLPVVTTRVPDVVADYAGVVHFADDGSATAAACRHVADHACSERDERVRPLRDRHEWDAIAAAIETLMTDAQRRAASSEGATA